MNNNNTYYTDYAEHNIIDILEVTNVLILLK